MILTTAGNPTTQVISVKFMYDGHSRIVDNIDWDGKLLVGFEMRKSGKFSYKIKKFSRDKINLSTLRVIDPPVRRGPVLSRPTR